MLMSRIQAASLEARKQKQTDRATVLVTLLAAIQKVGKDDGNRNTTDDESVDIIKSFLNKIKEFLALPTTEDVRTRLVAEQAIYEEFLPAQADEAEIRASIQAAVSTLVEKSPKAMGAVMKVLTERFGSNYDRALASRLVKEALAA